LGARWPDAQKQIFRSDRRSSSNETSRNSFGEIGRVREFVQADQRRTMNRGSAAGADHLKLLHLDQRFQYTQIGAISTYENYIGRVAPLGEPGSLREWGVRVPHAWNGRPGLVPEGIGAANPRKS